MSRFTPGDHLVTARLGYTHHGLYVGGDLVIHYQGPNHGLMYRIFSYNQLK
ncbi:lecithin retinol acyltransferase family protein [Aeromonas hydrophila]